LAFALRNFQVTLEFCANGADKAMSFDIGKQPSLVNTPRARTATDGEQCAFVVENCAQ
jgi:hypothetical protein